MATKTAVPASTGTFLVPPIKRVTVDVAVEGLSSLVMNQWSEKAKKQLLDSQNGTPKTKKREPKVPEDDCKGATYFRPDGSYGFPSCAFKSGMARAAKQVEGLAMTDVKASVFIRPQDDVDPELVWIEPLDDGPVMRSDMVRLQGNKADIRFRPEFARWRAHLQIELNANGLITPEEAVNLLNLAGFHAGIGERRPEKGGDWGRYQVVVQDV